MKNNILLFIFLLISVYSAAQIVNIPDASFKYALVNHIPVIDINGDGEIQISEAINYTDTIDVGGKNISDLTGIEYFTQITGLYCWTNQLTSIDVSNNTALKVLRCSGNQLSSIDVSNNTALIELGCGDSLTSLDVSNNIALEFLLCGCKLSSLDVSNNVNLKYLHCSYNLLNNIDVSNNIALTQLYCDNNLLTTLDVSNNVNLTGLSCNGNQFSTLDISSNTNLEYFAFVSNQITNIDFSQNDSLKTLVCSDNPLTLLDVSNNSKLRVIACQNTPLTEIDLSNNPRLYEVHLNSNLLVNSVSIKNGGNTTYLGLFVANDNPNLICIESDDSAFCTIHWGQLIDSTAYFSENCNTGINETKTFECLQVYPNPCDDNIDISFPTEDIYEVTIRNLTGEIIYHRFINNSILNVPTKDFPKGLLIIYIANKNGVYVKKTIKI